MIFNYKYKIRIVLTILILFSFSFLLSPRVFAQEQSWADYLESIWEEKKGEWEELFKRKTLPPGISTAWDGTYSASPPESSTEEGKFIYNIYTAEELAWIAHYYGKKGYGTEDVNITNESAIVRLMNDIDLGGEHNWTVFGSTFKGEFDGQGHTIYNMLCNYPNSKNIGFIRLIASSGVMHDVNFSYCKTIAQQYVGTATGFVDGDIQNVKVENSWVEVPKSYSEDTSNDTNVAGVFGYCNTYKVIKNIASINNIIYGRDHVGAVTVMPRHIANSYAIHCTVISTGFHSGGFISCTDYLKSIRNCFSDCTVYGTSETGAFLGHSFNNEGSRAIIENCFAQGSVEGVSVIGGFCPALDGKGYWNDEKKKYNGGGLTVRNCYSTAIVGMKNGGKFMGSFVGEVKKDVIFENCYAAGEVGGLDNDAPFANPNYTADFAAYNSIGYSIDKSKRYVGGFAGISLQNVEDTINNETHTVTYKNCYYDKQTTAMREVASGVGDIDGITGLLTNSTKGDYQKMVGYELDGFDASIWKFEDNLYPQLKIFEDSSSSTFTSPLDKVRAKAYSGASVSTPLLNPWDNIPSIPPHAYDTVRDITLSFPLTKNPNYDLKWTNDKIKGVVEPDKPIIEFTQDSFYANVKTVGIEWVYANNTVNEMGIAVTAIRPLRVIPTKSLDAGIDQIKNVGDWYDNWADVTLIDSTALGLNEHILGGEKIEPKIGKNARLLVENGSAPVYTKNSPYILDNFNKHYDYFNTSYINKIFNGGKPIPAYYAGKEFTISYSWVLPDGRYLQDSKLLEVLGKMVHIRQVVMDYDSEKNVDMPVIGYMKLNNVKVEDISSIKFTSNINTNSGLAQNNPPFSDFSLSIDPTYMGYTVDCIIPQYYEYQGYNMTSVNLPHDAMSRDTGSPILLDYNNSNEYWITIYIKQIDNNTGNKIDYYTNDFGTI